MVVVLCVLTRVVLSCTVEELVQAVSDVMAAQEV